MKYNEIQGQKMSSIMLGTVQLGMDYGLGDNTAKPSKEYAFSVLDSAVDCGINFLDTANNYGDSEAVIGAWLRQVDEDKRPLIVTKIGPFDHTSPEILEADILNQTKKCMETLGVSCIDLMMVHSYDDYKKSPDVVKKTFQYMKESGMIRFSGISAYSEHDYFHIAESGFDSVQIPLNVFDWGQIDNGGIQAMADAGMRVFVRSVYLQGLVFFKSNEVDERMDFCRPYIKKFEEFCEKFHLSAPALAISFALSVPGIASIVLGCQTPEQVKQNCELIDSARQLTDAEMEEIHEAFKDIDPRVINPRLWFNKF